ncbi:MAG TPA: isoaspartyl peptidase/L-asparaginase [Verrucomicrobiales bacterium]|nr:isoaspartyl peptidase/L-asparaginase [Verrucomicrobiales bacterium]
MTPCVLAADSPIAIVVHGGTVSQSPGDYGEELKEAQKEVIVAALRAGHAVLEEGGSSLDAVQAAVLILEDSPLFNAGKGAVFTNEGRNELDASVMEGKGLRAGAVGGVTTIRNPVLAARAVMEKSPHVLMTGAGAEKFAAEQGLELVDPAYFRTEDRLRELEQLQERLKRQEREAEERRGEEQGSAAERTRQSPVGKREEGAAQESLGTVGAVALDRSGTIAAATSTGGLTNKRFGRIGDSPIIGAGTYADNRAGGISCTGHGEYFIRYAIAYDILARVRYREDSLSESCREVVQGVLKEAGGRGGVIGLDPSGEVVMEQNTPGMVRGCIDTGGNLRFAVFAEER